MSDEINGQTKLLCCAYLVQNWNKWGSFMLWNGSTIYIFKDHKSV